MNNEATFREFAPEQRVFGRYTLKKILGRGGMGIVWLARDEELERDVALKFLPDVVVTDKALLGDLKRETRRSLELTHKNIVRIYDFVQGENSACISMEYIDGDTLSNLRTEKEQKVFHPEEIAAWTSQLCEALDYAHNHARIIHRDLKPANLMVNQKGELKVSDFGIARRLGDSMSQLTMAKGTSGTLVYMSPQQLNGERGTHLDDIYSLGATLYDLLTSKPPFYSGNVDKQVHERTAPSMTERRKEFNLEPALVPPLWEAAVAACLAKDPAQRPQSAGEFAERLQLSPRRSLTVVSAPPVKRRALWIGLAACGLIALAGFYFAKSKPAARPSSNPPATPAPAVAISEKSIAVLPFENMSDDKENAFFADGIQDDVLNSLAKIKELKVISRSSVMSYRGTAGRNVREIGHQLGVAHILEGSVRRTTDRVLVNVDLIDTQNDRQIWAERYDRTLGDSLTLQGELATEIAAALRATLSPEEKARIEARPTENSEAYVLYLRGREYQNRPSNLLEDDETAVHLYTQALALDPNFALAHARLSATLAHTYAGFQPTVEIKSRARAAAEESLRLRPDLGEGYLARALCLYWTEMDYNGALRQLESAGRLLPNDADVESIGAYINRRNGHCRDALAGIVRALARDPRNASIARELMSTQHMVRNWPAAEEAGERAVALAPERPAVAIEKSYVAFWSKGDLRPLQAVLLAIPSRVDPEGEVTWARWDAALLQRDFDAAERAVNARTADTMLSAFGTPLPKSYLLGCIATARGEPARAQPLFEAARDTLEADAWKFPLDAKRHAQLGLFYAYVGRKEDALREGRRAVELLPESSDTYLGPTISSLMAMIYARCDEPDQALALIEHLLTIPEPWVFEGSMTISDLRVRWQWDPLRSDPRFQKILEGPEPKTVY